jgi:hypothetical protein
MALPATAVVYKIDIVDQTGAPYLNASSVTVCTTGTTTAATIYTNDSRATSVTNPITTGLSDGSFDFYGDQPYYDFIVKSTVNSAIINAKTILPTKGRIVYPTNFNVAAPGDTNQIYNIVKTRRVTIGNVASTDTDFNFAPAANTTEQPIDCGHLVPAFARVIDVQLFTTTAAVFSGGATTLVAEMGSATSGNQYAASATIYAIDVILSCATGTAPIAASVATDGHVWVSATPGANWSTMTAGTWTLLVTYIDGGAIK